MMVNLELDGLVNLAYGHVRIMKIWKAFDVLLVALLTRLFENTILGLRLGKYVLIGMEFNISVLER
jgi:hypothetical protein